MDSHNVAPNTFSQTSNTQINNANVILTNENLDKSDGLAETLKELTINDAGYYVSDSANTNDAKGNPERNPKTVTHTGGGKKINITYTSNGICNKNY